MKVLIIGTLLVNLAMVMLYKWTIRYEEISTVYVDEHEKK